MELPYVTDPKLGIGGKLRAIPEHFVVEEIVDCFYFSVVLRVVELELGRIDENVLEDRK